jgi:hypothetical protein
MLDVRRHSPTIPPTLLTSLRLLQSVRLSPPCFRSSQVLASVPLLRLAGVSQGRRAISTVRPFSSVRSPLELGGMIAKRDGGGRRWPEKPRDFAGILPNDAGVGRA